jgi:hypothetical protein
VLFGQLLAFLAMPVTLPMVAGLVAEAPLVEPGVLFAGLGLLVAPAALAGLMLRRLLAPARGVATGSRLDALGVLAVAVMGLALGDGLIALAAEVPELPWIILGVLVASAVGALAGAAVAAVLGGPLIAAFGMAGAVRSVGLVWCSITGLAAAEGELALRVALAWSLLLPALVLLLQRLADARGWRLP